MPKKKKKPTATSDKSNKFAPRRGKKSGKAGKKKKK
jgi:hypothetical protein